MTALALALATSLGIGYVPFAPGTFGAAAGLAVWALLPGTPLVQVVAIVAVFALGSWSASVTEHHLRRTDPSIVVIDEVLGMMVTLAFVPVGWGGVVVGFLLFRAFDVWKPYPANRLEQLHGGFGIMADDAMAGVYANMVLRLAVAVAPAGWL